MSGIRAEIREIIRPFAGGVEPDTKTAKTIFFHQGLYITTNRDHSKFELWFTSELKHPRHALKTNKAKMTFTRPNTGKLLLDEHVTVKAIYAAGYIGHLYAARFRCSMRVVRAMFLFTIKTITNCPTTTLENITNSETCQLILETPYKNLEKLSLLSHSPRTVSAPLFNAPTEESKHPSRKRVRLHPPEGAAAPKPQPIFPTLRVAPAPALTLILPTLTSSIFGIKRTLSLNIAPFDFSIGALWDEGFGEQLELDQRRIDIKWASIWSSPLPDTVTFVEKPHPTHSGYSILDFDPPKDRSVPLDTGTRDIIREHNSIFQQHGGKPPVVKLDDNSLYLI